MPTIKYEKLAADKVGEDSQTVRARVEAARQQQRERFKNDKIQTNSEMNLPQMKKYCQLDSAGQEILKTAVQNLKLSARAYHRILKLARTIADLSLAPDIQADHLAEALQYRPKEDNF